MPLTDHCQACWQVDADPRRWMAAQLACEALLAELLTASHAPRVKFRDADRRGLRSGAKESVQLPPRESLPRFTAS